MPTQSPAFVPSRDGARPERLFARMVRLWIEYHARLLEIGIHPL